MGVHLVRVRMLADKLIRERFAGCIESWGTQRTLDSTIGNSRATRMCEELRNMRTFKNQIGIFMLLISSTVE